MRFTLRQMAVFVAVARQESVSRAAEALSLSQSATSTALGELERLYDTQLFDRVGKALRLNEIGQSLLPQAMELIEHADAIETVLEGRAGFGTLRIGASYGFVNLHRDVDGSGSVILGDTLTATFPTTSLGFTGKDTTRFEMFGFFIQAGILL